MIEVVSLTKRFEGRTILDGVTASFGRGEVVALIGPSGGGKSTLLRCLNGLETFEGGTVSVAGLALQGGTVRDARVLHAVRQKLGFVFQQWHLFAHRTALGNVMEAPLTVKQAVPAEAKARAMALLERVGMAHRAGAYPHEMSGGEQQRVAIARALAMDPEALLLDEPTSALDPERVADVAALLRGLSQDGLTLLIVTHEMRFVREVSSRVLVLHSGRIVEEGVPGEILERPLHERTRAFLGLGRAVGTEGGNRT